jgi:hypothetical protein
LSWLLWLLLSLLTLLKHLQPHHQKEMAWSMVTITVGSCISQYSCLSCCNKATIITKVEI